MISLNPQSDQNKTVQKIAVGTKLASVTLAASSIVTAYFFPHKIIIVGAGVFSYLCFEVGNMAHNIQQLASSTTAQIKPRISRLNCINAITVNSDIIYPLNTSWCAKWGMELSTPDNFHLEFFN